MLPYIAVTIDGGRWALLSRVWLRRSSYTTGGSETKANNMDGHGSACRPPSVSVLSTPKWQLSTCALHSIISSFQERETCLLTDEQNKVWNLHTLDYSPRSGWNPVIWSSTSGNKEPDAECNQQRPEIDLCACLLCEHHSRWSHRVERRRTLPRS